MEDLEDVVAQRAKELYDTCDIEGKGYIVKKEMDRLVDILHLSQEQLDAVFDSLDDDGNGQLTLQEFTEGFGQFIVGDIKSKYAKRKRHSSVFGDGFGDNEMRFRESMTGSVLSTETASDLYEKLQNEYPELLPGFENLLSKLSQEIEKSHLSVKKIENTIAQEATNHEEKIHNLYSEMESQIKTEEKRLLNEEKIKEKQIREQKEQELKDKDKHYQQLVWKHEQTKQRLQELNQQTGETQQEIEELAEEKDMLEEALEETQLNLEESQSILEELRNKSKEDRRQRAVTAGTVSIGITSEKESLLNQLKQLREINKKLKDERDEGLMYSTDTSRSDSPECEIQDRPPIHNYEPREDSDDIDGSAMKPDLRKIKLADASRLFGNSMNIFETMKYDDCVVDDDDGIEVDEEPATISEEPVENRLMYRVSITSVEEPTIFTDEIEKEEISPQEIEIQTEVEDDIPEEKEKPIQISYRLVFSGEEMPESVFKIVLVGDTNVGKSAVLDRFVNGTFKADYVHTIGVDFQLRSLIVEENIIALQVWDTAGQERFASITKQYYRKADGVVLVYDMMQQGSFLNLRNWIDNVEKNTNDEVMLMLLGNKLDLSTSKPQAIPTKNACDLSREYGALFFEVSALSGDNIYEAFATLAKILKSRQDKEMNDAIQLVPSTTKSSCCCKKTDRVSKRSEIINSKKNN